MRERECVYGERNTTRERESQRCQSFRARSLHSVFLFSFLLHYFATSIEISESLSRKAISMITPRNFHSTTTTTLTLVQIQISRSKIFFRNNIFFAKKISAKRRPFVDVWMEADVDKKIWIRTKNVSCARLLIFSARRCRRRCCCTVFCDLSKHLWLLFCLFLSK